MANLLDVVRPVPEAVFVLDSSVLGRHFLWYRYEDHFSKQVNEILSIEVIKTARLPVFCIIV